MDNSTIRAVLTALACGDALGKSTEFASRRMISESFGIVDRLLTPEESLAHRELFLGQVTDDTEQNMYLIEDYKLNGGVTPETAAASLLRWYRTAPDAEKYIGPSSRAAIYALEAGGNPRKTGKRGTSCGGVMRTPAAVLCTTDESRLAENVLSALIPTHDTRQAVEAAEGYAFAMLAASKKLGRDAIIREALRGCELGNSHYCASWRDDTDCVPTSAARVRYIAGIVDSFSDDGAFLDFLFYVLGTGIASYEVFPAAFAIFLRCGADAWRAIKLGASVGGDTDTIACLAGALCAALSGECNIPREISDTVVSVNHLKI